MVTDVTTACGSKSEQTWLCTQVYRVTGNKDAAEVADSLAKPLRIVLIVVVAWLAVTILSRVIRRMAAHVRDEGTLTALRRGIGIPDAGARVRLRRAQRAETISAVLRNVAAVVIWTIAVIAVLGVLGVDLAPLIAGAGIAGIALGFGAQAIVRDYLAGLYVVLEDQYGVGDVVDVGPATGTVEWVSLRVTRLRDAEGVAWHVPNGEIKRVANFSQRRPTPGNPEPADAPEDAPAVPPAADSDAEGGPAATGR
jgi:small conductance mechanosensitive channel